MVAPTNNDDSARGSLYQIAACGETRRFRFFARSVGDTDFAAVGSCVTRCWKLSFQRNVEIAVRAQPNPYAKRCNRCFRFRATEEPWTVRRQYDRRRLDDRLRNFHRFRGNRPASWQPCFATRRLVDEWFDDRDGGSLLRGACRSDAHRRRRVHFLARVTGSAVGLFIRMDHAASDSDGHYRCGGHCVRELHRGALLPYFIGRMDMEAGDVRTL